MAYMSNRLAIDVVLLPTDEVMDIAIDLNKKFGPVFELNKNDCLPHITLFQFIVEKSNFEELKERLLKIASAFEPINLAGRTDVHAGAFLGVNQTSDFKFDNKGSIRKLHFQIITNLQELVTFDARGEDFFDKNVRQRSLDWVKNFIENAAFEKYSPHITLGTKTPVNPPVDIEFNASRLAICHLGDYNTCREVLFESRLTA